MTLRSIGSDGNAWYMKLKPKSATTPVTEKKLVWSDEFNTDGAPNPAVWGYDLGNNNGWGNNEVQYYTNRADNAVVQGGVLKITAKKKAIKVQTIHLHVYCRSISILLLTAVLIFVQNYHPQEVLGLHYGCWALIFRRWGGQLAVK
jgi:hypothetical protein